MSRRVFVPSEVQVLAPFVRAGVLGLTEVHAACTFARATGETSLEVILAAALAVRAPLHGSVCVDLATVQHSVVSSLESPAELSGEPAREVTADGSQGDDPTGTDTPGDLSALPWPDPAMWLDRVRGSELVDAATDGGRREGEPAALAPLVADAGLLYLARYWALERYVAADLRGRSGRAAVGPTAAGHEGGPDPIGASRSEVLRLFEASAAATGGEIDTDQLAAAQAAVTQDFVVISGGPGTGKTTTVARLLAGLIAGLDQAGVDERVALVAPTGKAAARMTEAIRQAVDALHAELDDQVVVSLNALEAVTVHRLLGRADGAGFRHRPDNPLPHDIVVVDEVSMVSLSLMAHLLAAVRPAAKVVLVGDPYQLSSVEAGAVLGDIVGIGAPGADPADPQPPASIATSVRPLRVIHRQGADSGILELAVTIREGRADDAIDLLRAGRPDVKWIDPDDPDHAAALGDIREEVTATAEAAVAAARDLDVSRALERIGELKVLSALRRGRSGVDGWNQLVEDGLRSRNVIRWNSWYSGRPVMVTENDYLNGVFNGDVGVSVRNGDHYQVWFPRADRPQMVEAVRLDRLVTQWAMSIHKSQGSEFPHVVVALPSPPARILTRELVYTAVTRAKDRLTVVAPAESIRAAVDRPVARASGLARRLAADAT